jgi:hypothetical protein
MDLHNNTIDEKALLSRMKWRVINLIGRAKDRRLWYAMRECIEVSIQETDLPFHRLEQLFYMVALDHINGEFVGDTESVLAALLVVKTVGDSHDC